MVPPTVKAIAVSNPTGPQFLEAKRTKGVSEEATTVFINTSDIGVVTPIGSYHLQIQLPSEVVTVKATLMSFKEALNFLRQTPHRGSVVLREQWDGRRKSSDDDLDTLDDIIPDEDAVKV